MVKKKAPTKTRTARKDAVKKVPVKTDIASVEEETIKRANRTITSIEGFLAKWEASRAKPNDMLPQVVKIRQFHDALVSWQKVAVKAKGKDQDATMKRLKDLVLICRTYS